MPRIITRQAAAGKPVRIVLPLVPDTWTTILEAPDFSVGDTTRRYPGRRDPNDDDRFIQAGFALIEAPLVFYNPTNTARWIEIRTLTEDGQVIPQVRQVIPPADTFLHPAPGQHLLKTLIAAPNGDRLQVRAEVGTAISLTGAASEGAAEDHQPEISA